MNSIRLSLYIVTEYYLTSAYIAHPFYAHKPRLGLLTKNNTFNTNRNNVKAFFGYICVFKYVRVIPDICFHLKGILNPPLKH